MLSHKATWGSLDAYSDGTLPDSQRADVATHLQTCAKCGESLRQIHHLDQVLNDLPPMQGVPFARFWSKLEPRLPNHVQKRAPFLRPSRVAASLTLAVLASLVGVVALASDGVLPDSPLYSVKHFRQGVQLSLAGAHERPRLELFLGKQRLHEAAVMVQRKRHDLALASLRDFHALIVDAAPRLENSGGQLDIADLTSTVAQIKTELDAVRGTNDSQEGSDPADIAAVDDAVQDARNAVSKVESGVDRSGPGIVESPSLQESASPALSPSISD